MQLLLQGRKKLLVSPVDGKERNEAWMTIDHCGTHSQPFFTAVMTIGGDEQAAGGIEKAIKESDDGAPTNPRHIHPPFVE